MQLSFSAEPALGLVLCFSEVTGLFPQASSVTARPSPSSRVQKENWRADSCLRSPPDTSLRTPSSRKAGPALPHKMSPDPVLPGPEKPPSQGGRPVPTWQWGHTLHVKRPTGVLLLCTIATTMPGPARLGEQNIARGPAMVHKEWPEWRAAGLGAAGCPANLCPCSLGL